MPLSLQFLRPGELLETDPARAINLPPCFGTLDILKSTQAKVYLTQANLSTPDIACSSGEQGGHWGGKQGVGGRERGWE